MTHKKKHTKETLKETLELHRKLLLMEDGGERANLRFANLGGADLRNVDLEGANLEKANLRYADLRFANLEKANLGGANLRNVDLEKANLGGANLEKANLRYADLRFANLEKANLGGANLRFANLEEADLSQITMSWYSHDLISARLYQKADTLPRKAFSALIARDYGSCWESFQETLPFEFQEWALSIMKEWVKEDDELPSILKEALDNHNAKGNNDPKE